MIEKSWSSQLFFSLVGENVALMCSICFSEASRKITMIWLKNENLKIHPLPLFLGTLS